MSHTCTPGRTSAGITKRSLFKLSITIMFIFTYSFSFIFTDIKTLDYFCFDNIFPWGKLQQKEKSHGKHSINNLNQENNFDQFFQSSQVYLYLTSLEMMSALSAGVNFHNNKRSVRFNGIFKGFFRTTSTPTVSETAEELQSLNLHVSLFMHQSKHLTLRHTMSINFLYSYCIDVPVNKF